MIALRTSQHSAGALIDAHLWRHPTVARHHGRDRCVGLRPIGEHDACEDRPFLIEASPFLVGPSAEGMRTGGAVRLPKGREVQNAGYLTCRAQTASTGRPSEYPSDDFVGI